MGIEVVSGEWRVDTIFIDYQISNVTSRRSTSLRPAGINLDFIRRHVVVVTPDIRTLYPVFKFLEKQLSIYSYPCSFVKYLLGSLAFISNNYYIKTDRKRVHILAVLTIREFAMNKTFEQGKHEIAGLCDYFIKNRSAFFAPGVKEAHIRQNLIDPFFEALGWDVRNTARIAPQYREVIPEDTLEVEGQQKAPDYTFRVGTLPKFYVEAKKCGLNISADPVPAYQLRRYGWSAKLPLSILTDFEEFAVYDCTQRPRPNDKASHARIKYLNFEEYPDNWRELWDIFSREAVWSGAFDHYAASKRAKRGTSEVDSEFLKEIEGWRDALARNIALRNTDISSEDLNRAVQLTIDRVIFLRMAEDRRLEPDEQLLKLSERPDIYARFMGDLCRLADQKYNSGLFHFQKESGVSEAPDQITPNLTVDDKVFKPILESLYFAHGSPYHFGVMPVEILGTIYERFLGKVIHLTEGHHAKVQEKPEVRKAGGVYYTPAYIVNYIVKNTVGKQIENKTPAQLAGGKTKPPFRVLDMACGSGSFLLGAFQCLLDHCLKWYVEHKPGSFKKAVYKDPRNDNWRLTIEEKKRILTTHIFGVDIDAQAVEVSKLSLLLKVLEGETDQSLHLGLLPFSDRALPNLADNIKCGNSLIGSDYFTGKLISDPDEMQRINPFDWKQGFPDAMKAGGFDCVIGNPPYIRIQTMKEWAPLEVEIYKELFKAAKSGNYDIYVVFMEKGLQLLNPHGRLSFIIPHKFFNSKYGEPLRGIISKGEHLSHVVHFGDQQVFDGPTTYTCLMFLDKAKCKECRFVKVDSLESWKAAISNGDNNLDTTHGIAEGMIPATQVTSAEWNFHVGNGAALFKKLNRMPVKLKDVSSRIMQGLVTGADAVFVLTNADKGTYYSEATSKYHHIESALLHPLCKGSVNLRRYHVSEVTKSILFPYKYVGGKALLLSPKELSKKYPHAWKYLQLNQKDLQEREHGKWKHEKWYAFGRSQNLSQMEQKKILTPSIAKVVSFTFDSIDSYYFLGSGGGGGGGYGITLKNESLFTYEYILGLLNSHLLDWIVKRTSSYFRGGYYAFSRQFIEQLPIRPINFCSKTEKAKHERMVRLVENMLTLHKHLAAAKSEARKTVIQRQIDATDAEIDHLVYDLYDLTDEEIAIVEGKNL